MDTLIGLGCCCMCVWPMFVFIGLIIKELTGNGNDSDGGNSFIVAG